MVVHEHCDLPLDMEGLLVFVDSDIDEDELKVLQKKIKKMARRRLSKKNGHADGSLSSSSASPCMESTSTSLKMDVENGCADYSENSANLEDVKTLKSNKRKRILAGEVMKTNKKRKNNSDGADRVADQCHSRNGPVALKSKGKRGRSPVYNGLCSSDMSENVESDPSSGSKNDPQCVVKSDTVIKKANTISASERTAHKPYKLTRQLSSQTNSDHIATKTAEGIPSSSRLSDFTLCNGYSSSSVSGLTKENTNLSCLTRCQSCTVYQLPVLSAEDHAELANYVALDCEFVGIGPKKTSALGRCSIVDCSGVILFDRFVKPADLVTDYRTPWSGLRPKNIRSGIPFVAAQEQISAIIKGKVVVGHAVHNDFRVMGIAHPTHMIRDTASCKLLREMADLGRGSCALRTLTQALLGRKIQTGEHCSVTDARAALDLFRLVQTSWEPVLQAKFSRRKARLAVETGRPSDDPELKSYLEDHYWPPDLFID